MKTIKHIDGSEFLRQFKTSGEINGANARRMEKAVPYAADKQGSP